MGGRRKPVRGREGDRERFVLLSFKKKKKIAVNLLEQHSSKLTLKEERLFEFFSMFTCL